MDHSIFCGRLKELQLLKDSWHRLKNDPSYHPEVHVLTAESGLGKTRIVQEFYNWLSINAEGTGKNGYWPDALGKSGRSLEVSPAPNLCNSANEISYLWLGVRCLDTGQHNSIRDGEALQTEMQAFQCHLNSFVEQAGKRRNHFNKGVATGLDVAAQLAGALPVVGTPIGVAKTALDIYQRYFGSEGGVPPEPHEIALAAIRIVFEQTKKHRLPLILVLDDIQFSQGEWSLSRLTRQLVAEAGQNHWPLMVIATSWQKEWASGDQTCLLIAALQDSRDQRYIRAENLKVIPVTPLRSSEDDPGLEPLVSAQFPGLTTTQRKAVSDHADGNPRFLDELLLHLDTREDLFIDFDKTGALEPGALDEIEKLELEKVIESRLRAAGPEVYQLLALGGIQGMEFSERLAEELQAKLNADHQVDNKSIIFQRSEDPFGFIQRRAFGLSEFVQRPYQKIAESFIRTFVKPPSAAEDALKALLKTCMENPNDLADQELLHCCDLTLQ
ncbi:hypothetical protein [Roseibium polysiphoniae]|uniref:Orc1-like AAA ATPase domain-containing protein n=1 Tax=Roseibium polysiphoniae TaxID=2571221 RepID=A0ABR9C8H6_9HYPH|nr:hypothetical protein [Roseibium polysiphoniae]MBD8876195.1 hypothetical protein [Roseibium polysiphoniae]